MLIVTILFIPIVGKYTTFGDNACRVLFVTFGMRTIKDLARRLDSRCLPVSHLLPKHPHRAHCNLLPATLDLWDHDLLGDSDEL